MANKSIGEANVKLTVEGADQVASKINEVKTELDSAAAAGTNATQKINGGFLAIGTSINNATRGVRAFAGSLTAILGIVAALSAIFTVTFGWLIRRLQKSREEAELLRESMSKIGDTAKEVAKALEGIASDPVSIDDQIKITESAALNALFKERAKVLADLDKKSNSGQSIETQLADEKKRQQIIADSKAAEKKIRLDADDARARLAEQRAKEQADIEAKIAEDSANKQKQIEESLADQLETIRIASLDGEERVLEEYQRRRQDRERAYQEAVEAGRQRESDLLDALDRQDAENTNKAIERIREQGRARDEADRNRAQQDQQRQEDQAARDLAMALRDAARAVQESAKIMNDNNRAIERLYQQVVNLVPAVKKTAEESTRRRVM